MSRNPLSSIWSAMKSRCYVESNPGYKYYGGRGIYICPEWLNDRRAFFSWAGDNGYQPDLTLDRINNDGPYSPENCRWATRTQQARNRRGNVHIEYQGKQMLICEVAEQVGMSPSTLGARLTMGWTVERATTTGFKPYKPKSTKQTREERNRLRQIIKEATGMSLQAFGEQYLDSQYMSLSYRIRHGVLRLDEYHTICYYTGKTFEDIWPTPYSFAPHKLSLKLNPQTFSSHLLPVDSKNIKVKPHRSTTISYPPPPKHGDDDLERDLGLLLPAYVTVSHKPPGDEGAQKKGEGNPRPAFVDPYEGIVPPEI